MAKVGRYPADPHKLDVVGIEAHLRRRRLGPGPVKVGARRFWAEEVEVVIRYAVPSVWRASGQRPSRGADR